MGDRRKDDIVQQSAADAIVSGKKCQLKYRFDIIK
jgi:hypothetical protein